MSLSLSPSVANSEVMLSGTSRVPSRSTSAVSDDEPAVVVYSADYDRELLARYLGESWSASHSSLPSPMYEPEQLDLSFDQYFNAVPPIDFMEDSYEPVPAAAGESNLFQEQQTAPDLVRTEPSVSQKARVAPYPAQEAAGTRKRGRPMKVGSNSKMALYARSYREQKKSELAIAQQEVAELRTENADLRQQVESMSSCLERVEAELLRLRKIVKAQDVNGYELVSPKSEFY